MPAVIGLELEVTFYELTYKHLRLATVDSKQWPIFTFVCVLLGKDLSYYLAHRFFHEFHVPWIGHSVHHSGK